MPDQTDRAALSADWDEGRRRGVRGSPHFFCGATAVFCPTLDIAKATVKATVKGLSVAPDVLRLSTFVELCLARTGPSEPSIRTRP